MGVYYSSGVCVVGGVDDVCVVWDSYCGVGIMI